MARGPLVSVMRITRTPFGPMTTDRSVCLLLFGKVALSAERPPGEGALTASALGSNLREGFR